MLNEFISNIKSGGLARTNRFAVVMSPPFSTGKNNLEKILMFCDTFNIPTTSFSTVENKQFGETRQVPYERLYDEASGTFYVDTNMEVRKLFNEWIDLIASPVTKNFNYYNSYVSDVIILVQDVANNNRYSITLHEAYPTSLGSISLDYSSREVMKQNITFKYKSWSQSSRISINGADVISDDLIKTYNVLFNDFQDIFNKSLPNINIKREDAQGFITAIQSEQSKIRELLSYSQRHLNIIDSIVPINKVATTV